MTDTVVWANELVDRLQQAVLYTPPSARTVAAGPYVMPAARTYFNLPYYIMSPGTVTISVQPGDALDGSASVVNRGLFVSDGTTWHRYV